MSRLWGREVWAPCVNARITDVRNSWNDVISPPQRTFAPKQADKSLEFLKVGGQGNDDVIATGPWADSAPPGKAPRYAHQSFAPFPANH